MAGGKGVIRKVIGKVVPGQHLNKAPGPRVLIVQPGSVWVPAARNHLPLFDAEGLAERLRQVVPTVAIAGSLGRFNLNEWDAVVVDNATVGLAEVHDATPTYNQRDTQPKHSWKQPFPPTLCVINVQSTGPFAVIDAHPSDSDGPSDYLPDLVVVRNPPTTGTHLRQVDGLSEGLSGLVSRELIPVARAQEEHNSFVRVGVKDLTEPFPENLDLTPFLLGPDDVILAASYERNDRASAWLLPDTVPDLYPWVIEALKEWHGLYPDRFPAIPDWHDHADWKTAAETEIGDRRAVLARDFEAKYERFKTDLAALDAEAQTASANATQYERALLTEDGDALALAVERALCDLGFRVVNMDLVWPEGDRREDLRVYDDENPEWVAIVEVKGAKNGPKETEVQNFGRWLARFILDEGRAPDAQWFVTNHQRRLDPTARQDPFGNKSAVLETFAKVDGTVVDTRALFDLLRLVDGQPDLLSAARAMLKAKPLSVIRVDEGDLQRFVEGKEEA